MQDILNPSNIGEGAGDPFNSVLLQTASTLYHPTTASHGIDGQVLPGELGHRYGGLRALSDPNTHEAILRGYDVTDGLAENGMGLAANITKHGQDRHGRDIPGSFDMVDSSGKVRRITYGIAMLGVSSTALLVDHPKFNKDVQGQLGGMHPAIAATGLAVIAKISREEPADPKRATLRYSQQALGLR